MVWLCSNASLSSMLKRLLKDIMDKNSTLRMNLIEVMCTILSSKFNFDKNDIEKSVLLVVYDLKRIIETDLSKDQSIQVRRSSDKLSAVIH